MIKTLSEQVAQLEKDLAEVKAKLANEAKKKPVTVGFEEPERGVKYWFVAGEGNIYSSIYSHQPIIDSGRLSIGNVFLTEDAAIKKQRRIETLAELKRMTNGFVPNSDDGWYEIFMGDNKNCETFFISRYSAGDAPRYRTREEARAAINAVGADRIKELMGV